MKKHLLIFFILFSLSAYTQWEWQNPLPQGNTIKAVEIIDADNIWAVGDCGTVIHTEDGGDSWELHFLGTYSNLRDIGFINNVGFILGENGVLMRTIDVGLNWESLNDSIGKTFTCIEKNSNTFWIAGFEFTGFIKKTMDSGNSWMNKSLQYTTISLEVQFVNDSVGWILGNQMYTTTNGGDYWQFRYHSPPNKYKKLFFLDEKNGWFNVLETLYHTYDGGTTWETQFNLEYHSIFDMCFIDSLTGWHVGNQNYMQVFETTDGGVNWYEDFSSGTGRLYTIEKFNDSIIWSAGSFGQMHMSVDTAGWITKTKGSILGISQIYFIDQNTGWAINNELILKTENSGLEWDTIIFDKYNRKSDIYFYNDQNGWLIDFYGIKKTVNGGNTWEYMDSIYFLNKLSFITPKYGWAIGDYGKIFHTEDWGNTWVKQDIQLNRNLNSVQFKSIEKGWTVGNNGTILYTKDGGDNWESQISATESDLMDLFFVNLINGWVVGDNGVILKTENGGESWEHQNSNTSRKIRAVHFTDHNTGWAVGNSGLILHTINGGEDWIEKISPSNNTFYCTHFFDENIGWIGGSGGNIIYTSNGGIVNTEDNPTQDFNRVSIVFPNPFSTFTRIKYSSVSNSKIHIHIFNSSGGLIHSNISTQSAGTHEYHWNSQEYPAGIYYYRIQINNESFAGKMIKL